MGRQQQQNIYGGGGFGSPSTMKFQQQTTPTNMPLQRQSPATGNWSSPQGHFNQNQVK